MSVLDALRTATASAHARLETAMDLDSGHLTLARYGAALQVLHAVRAGWEPGLEALHPGSTGPHRTWLEQDLTTLAFPLLPPAPALGGGDAEGWGVRYVLEGSALGGRVILRHAERLGLTPAHGARYFAGWGANTGPRWKAFLQDLEGTATPARQPAIVAGAVAAFSALARAASARFHEVLDPRQDLAPPFAAVEDPVMADAGLQVLHAPFAGDRGA